MPGAHTARSLPPPSFQLGSTPSPLLLLPDALLLVALGHLDTQSLVRLGLTCRRLRHLCWEPALWHRISLQGEVAADLAISCVLATLAREGGRGVVRAASLQACTRLTDHGLGEIARHCPALERLEVRACRGVTNSGVAEVVARCPGLHHLNLAGNTHLVTPYTVHTQTEAPPPLPRLLRRVRPLSRPGPQGTTQPRPCPHLPRPD